MPTGACGIDCDVCQLNMKGICSTCGPGTGAEGQKKLAAQTRILGSPCPILACAELKQVTYCLRDCEAFPCVNFENGPYPFSDGFLRMQSRRRLQDTPAWAPDGSEAELDPAYWEQLARRDGTELANLTLFAPAADRQLTFQFLNETVMVDLDARCLKHRQGGRWSRMADPLLELATVLYLINVRELVPMGREIVGLKDLKEGHFFQGPHELNLDPLLNRFGGDIAGFNAAAEALQGKPVDMADTAYRLMPYPRIPLFYLLWQGDDEFQPRIRVLLDRSIEALLAADAIWALINRVSQAILSVGLQAASSPHPGGHSA
jgi:hypothetical protein